MTTEETNTAREDNKGLFVLFAKRLWVEVVAGRELREAEKALRQADVAGVGFAISRRERAEKDYAKARLRTDDIVDSKVFRWLKRQWFTEGA